MAIDTASLYFRAFYGVPASLTTADGRPVNAVRGLADMVARLIEQYRPSHVAACWDCDWRPGWRVELVPSYKAHRVADPAELALPVDGRSPGALTFDVGVPQETEATPDELDAQVPWIVELLRAAGIAIVGAARAEADDVIGTICRRAPMPCDVVTGDRDLFQVVDDERAVRVLYVAKGVAKHEVIDAAAVRAKYGVGPEQYADLALLRGDASDGLPGVAGVGEKTAASLLRSYGDLEGILAAASDPGSPLAAGVRAKLAGAIDYLARARPVVRVVDDLPGDLDWDALALAGGEKPRLGDLGERLNLGGSTARLAAAIEAAAAPVG